MRAHHDVTIAAGTGASAPRTPVPEQRNVFVKRGVGAELGSVLVLLEMKDSCFIRPRSGLSSQELGANHHLKLRSSIALRINGIAQEH